MWIISEEKCGTGAKRFRTASQKCRRGMKKLSGGGHRPIAPLLSYTSACNCNGGLHSQTGDTVSRDHAYLFPVLKSAGSTFHLVANCSWCAKPFHHFLQKNQEFDLCDIWYISCEDRLQIHWWFFSLKFRQIELALEPREGISFWIQLFHNRRNMAYLIFYVSPLDRTSVRYSCKFF